MTTDQEYRDFHAWLEEKHRLNEIEDSNRIIEGDYSDEDITENAQKIRPEATGNTRGRGFSLTIFSKAELDTFIGIKSTYKCYGIETCPTTDKTHYQAYIYFKNKKTFNALKKLLPTSHIELSKGSAQQNKAYCSKDGDFHEEGTLPRQGFKQISANILRKLSDEDIINFDARCHRAYINARNKLNNVLTVNTFRKKVKVWYIQGPSGCGKTEKALQLIGDSTFCNVKCENGFWVGLGDTKTALYDDFRSSDMRAKDFINFIDYNRHSMNVKGSEERNNFETIIITSVERIEDIYSNLQGEPREQWMRRIEVINMY